MENTKLIIIDFFFLLLRRTLCPLLFRLGEFFHHFSFHHGLHGTWVRREKEKGIFVERGCVVRPASGYIFAMFCRGGLVF